jgi:hypothetical protein
MSDIFNKARQISEVDFGNPEHGKPLDFWREKFEKGKAVIYVSLHRRNLQVRSEQEGLDLVKKLDKLGVPATVQYYDSTGKDGGWKRADTDDKEN